MIEYEMARKPMLEKLAGVPVAVTPGASPYTYTATESGAMYLSAGTVTTVQITRGATTISTGILAGSYFLRNGDKLVVTYAISPTMNWVPL
jgi:hypothetical protein